MQDQRRFANATGNQLSIQARYFRADASSLGTRTITLPPLGCHLDDVLARLGVTTADDAHAIVSSATPGARYFTYASVIDNRTGDPIYIPAHVMEP